MSGHSKWNNIKRRKEKVDAQKGKIFTKIGREISVAVKKGGTDPATNFKLAECIEKAKSFNVPNDNIERIIKKASSSGVGDDCEELIYEGYGPGECAFMVKVLTDNKNRTAANLRMYFSKFGGNLGQQGCVSYLFDELGVIIINKEGVSEDSLMEDAINFSANDIQRDDDSFVIISDRMSFVNLKKQLEEKKYNIESCEISMVPKYYKEDLKNDELEKISRFVDSLEDDDDVQEVYHNAEFPEGWKE